MNSLARQAIPVARADTQREDSAGTALQFLAIGVLFLCWALEALLF